ncbi:MAG: YicC family protein [Firmicutes bacterium]|nr:YicC family protein [Bacillota bacterium]
MAVSMTGFGHTEKTKDDWQIMVEIRSVNHRYLDPVIRLPRRYQALEEPILKIVKEKINRGRIEIYVNIEELADKDRMVKIDKGIVRGLHAQWKELQQELPLSDLTFEHIIQLPDVIHISDLEIDWDSLTDIVCDAVYSGLEQLNAMRLAEGKRLAEDLNHKIDLVEQLICQIEERAPFVVDEYRQRLQERLQDLLEGTSLNQERFETEVTIFADKCTIDEEIVRLFSHVDQFRQSLNQNEPVGRKLDFLIQEMNREVNTIGSKANDLCITKLVLSLKSELERIREQVQNLE